MNAQATKLQAAENDLKQSVKPPRLLSCRSFSPRFLTHTY